MKHMDMLNHSNEQAAAAEHLTQSTQQRTQGLDSTFQVFCLKNIVEFVGNQLLMKCS